MRTRLILLLSSLLILTISSCVPHPMLKISSTTDNTLNNTCTVSGYVYDAKTKEPLKEAYIHLNDNQYFAATDDNGYFTIENVQPGSYLVSALYIGYEKYTKPNVRFEANHIYSLHIELICKIVVQY